jgi:hypothetical protein
MTSDVASPRPRIAWSRLTDQREAEPVLPQPGLTPPPSGAGGWYAVELGRWCRIRLFALLNALGHLGGNQSETVPDNQESFSPDRRENAKTQRSLDCRGSI